MWRELFDAGSLSEPIAARNIMLSWICARANIQLDSNTHPLPDFNAGAVFSAEFEAFKSLCESMAERVENFLTEELGLPVPEDISVFRYILNHYSARSGLEDSEDTSRIERSVADRVAYLMPATFLQLKFLLVVSFNRRIFHSTATSGNEKTALNFRINNMEDKPVGKEFLMRRSDSIKQLIHKIVGQEIDEIRFGSRGDQIEVKPGVSSTKGILIPDSVRVALQFFDKRRVMFRLDPQEDGGPLPVPEDFIYLVRPRVGRMVSWCHLTTIKDSRRKTRRAIIPVRFNHRNPVSWMIGASEPHHPTDYWAVASSIQGLSTIPDKEGTSWLTDTKADYVTILPTEFGGSLAIVMLLIALPFRGGLEALVSVNDDLDYRLSRFSVDGKWFQVHPLFPITKQVMARASAVRDLIISCTSIGRDENGELEDAMRQLTFVMKLLPNAITSLIQYCSEFYSIDHSDNDIWTQKIVKLVDVSKGPQLITDPRVWFKNDPHLLRQDHQVSDILEVDEDKFTVDGIDEFSDKEGFETPVRHSKDEISWSSPSTMCSPCELRPDQIRLGRQRMKHIGFSFREIDSRFPIW
jgi:hypothetical protein